ncbi:hypothetical protein [Photobacterium leiognathi]|uniref:hypothetical protein n=1 Tax=Photobacterium leiognathi TaxID=553611 RepID=UPI002981E97D|nr:hypothetical protein [Photobacterium leiognathi]
MLIKVIITLNIISDHIIHKNNQAYILNFEIWYIMKIVSQYLYIDQQKGTFMRNLADFIYHMEGGDQNFTIWVHDSNKRYKKLLVSDCKSIKFNDFLENQLNVIVEITALDGSNQAYLLLPEINAASTISFDNGEVISYIDAKAA